MISKGYGFLKLRKEKKMSNKKDLWKDYDLKRHSDISFDIEGLGLEGTVGSIIFEEVDDMIDRYNLTHEDIERYKENQSSYYDKTGKISDPYYVLETSGAYSVENLAFKVLRRSGYLGKLSDLKNASYDELMSMENGGGRIRIKI